MRFVKRLEDISRNNFIDLVLRWYFMELLKSAKPQSGKDTNIYTNAFDKNKIYFLNACKDEINACI